MSNKPETQSNLPIFPFTAEEIKKHQQMSEEIVAMELLKEKIGSIRDKSSDNDGNKLKNN